MKIEQFLFLNSRTFGKDGLAFQVTGMKSRTEVIGSERACLFVAVIPYLWEGGNSGGTTEDESCLSFLDQSVVDFSGGVNIHFTEGSRPHPEAG